MSELGKPLRMDVRLRNNRLIRAREALGFASAKSFADAAGVCYVTYASIEALTRSPWNRKTDGWKAIALKVAAALGRPPAELWPEELARVGKTRASMELDAGDVAAVLGGEPYAPSPEELYERAEHRTLVARAVDGLNERERAILEARLGGAKQMEVAHALGVSHARVWQFERRAADRVAQAVDEAHRPPPLPPPAAPAAAAPARRRRGWPAAWATEAERLAAWARAFAISVNGDPAFAAEALARMARRDEPAAVYVVEHGLTAALYEKRSACVDALEPVKIGSLAVACAVLRACRPFVHDSAHREFYLRAVAWAPDQEAALRCARSGRPPAGKATGT